MHLRGGLKCVRRNAQVSPFCPNVAMDGLVKTLVWAVEQYVITQVRSQIPLRALEGLTIFQYCTGIPIA